MTTIANIIRRGTTAAKPAANTVDVGTLYFDITLVKLQRSTGADWEDVAETVTLPAFVGARYTTNAGQSIDSSTGYTIVNFEDQDYDGDTLVTIGASWKFTAPSTGKYHIDVLVSFAGSSAWADLERGSLALYKGGAELLLLDRKDNLPTNANCFLSGSVTIPLTAAEYIDVRVSQNSGSAIALQAYATVNYINIEKVG